MYRSSTVILMYALHKILRPNSTYLSKGNELNNQCLLNGTLTKSLDWPRPLLTRTAYRQGPQAFKDNCQTSFTTIVTTDCDLLYLHETLSTTIEAKRTLYKKHAVQAFVRGLCKPFGSPHQVHEAQQYRGNFKICMGVKCNVPPTTQAHSQNIAY